MDFNKFLYDFLMKLPTAALKKRYHMITAHLHQLFNRHGVFEFIKERNVSKTFNIFSIGCGYAEEVPILAYETKNFEGNIRYVCFDINKLLLETWKLLSDFNATFNISDASRLESFHNVFDPDTVDLIIMRHPFGDTTKAFEDICRIVVPSIINSKGKIFISNYYKNELIYFDKLTNHFIVGKINIVISPVIKLSGMDIKGSFIKSCYADHISALVNIDENQLSTYRKNMPPSAQITTSFMQSHYGAMTQGFIKGSADVFKSGLQLNGFSQQTCTIGALLFYFMFMLLLIAITRFFENDPTSSLYPMQSTTHELLSSLAYALLFTLFYYACEKVTNKLDKLSVWLKNRGQPKGALATRVLTNAPTLLLYGHDAIYNPQSIPNITTKISLAILAEWTTKKVGKKLLGTDKTPRKVYHPSCKI